MIWLRFMGGVSQWPRVAASCVEAAALFRLGESEGEKNTLWKRIVIALLKLNGFSKIDFDDKTIHCLQDPQAVVCGE